MHYKTFTRLFLLIGMIGWLSLPAQAQTGSGNRELIEIGTGTSTTYEAPVNTYYKYSLTEMIYTSDEIGTGGTISSIGFHYALNTQKDFAVVVFMKHVTRSSFPSTTAFETLYETDIVYDGTMSVSSPGWVTLTLDTPFEYDGESNLLIAFDNNTGSYIGSNGSFYYTTTSNRVYRFQNDNTNPDPLTFNSYAASSVSSSLPNLQLDITPAYVSCPKQKNLTASEISARTATLDWAKGDETQDTWEVYLTQTASDVPNEETPATHAENVTKPFALSDLTPEQDYYAYVRANCGNDDLSKWSAVCHFTTLPSCVTPTNLVSSQVTTNGTTLSWTTDSGQTAWEIYLTTTATDVPTAETQATHPNVSSNPYALTGLSSQTKYYAYVRANCGDVDGKSDWSAGCSFTTPQVAVAIDATHPYSDGFESSCDWVLVNGTLTNQWSWGEATDNGGEKALYVSKDGGTTYEYTHSNTMIYATKNFDFAQGTYTFIYDWNAKGESTYDYLRVALVPAGTELVASNSIPSGFSASALPSGWIALDGGSKLNLTDNWQTKTVEASVSAGNYMMVFAWRNDGSGGNQPPAAIDNISISLLSCPRPTGLAESNVTGRTATLAWTAGGDETQWVLQYATNATFTQDLVETDVDETHMDLTGLSGETTYYARVKAACSETDESAWSDVKSFTTLATCVKPTLSYAANSNTAHTGTVEWTGSAISYEMAYRAGTTDFDPSDMTLEDVVRIQLGNVNTYTLQDLQPETKHYIYVRAYCGEEDGYSAWSNRVIFTTLATCIAPSSLTKEATTANSVTLSWTKGADGQDAWQFRYKKTSDSEYTYLLVEDQSTALYTLEGLDAATSYDVNVRAWCGEEDYSKWSYANQTYDLTITTECADLTLPYFNDFEGALETSQSSSYPMPKCWTRIAYQGGYYGNYSYYPYVFTATSSQPYNHGESSANGHCLRFYRTATSQKEAAVLPAIDDQYQMQDLQIRFWARLESYNTNKDLSVGIMTDPNDMNTFVEITPFVTVENDQFKEYTVSFENYQGEGRYIAISFNTSSLYNVYVDDVTVELIPSCRIPKELEATEITENQATLTWTAGKDETAWNVQYKKASDSDWSELIPVSQTTCTISNLKRGTVYEARVQANCNADDQSDWTEPISFTTECGIWPIDAENALLENFDDDFNSFPPTCWSKLPAYSGWGVNFNNAMVNDQPEPHGAAYSGTLTNANTYLILPQMHLDGEATLSFDQLFGSTGDYATSSIIVFTEMGTVDQLNLIEPVWTADASNLPSVRTNETVSLSNYDGQDVYVAFKYEGMGSSGKTWYVDNIQVAVLSTLTKDIAGFGSSNKAGYYLIASPVAEVTPTAENGFLTNTYDLYYFDESQEHEEWRNYKVEGHAFNLVSGKGYLYANSDDTTLTFTGVPYTGNGKVTLAYTAGKNFSGWNLIGNPFATAATLDMPYYRLNEEGSEVNPETEEDNIDAMEGVFVYTNAATTEANFAAVSRGATGEELAKVNINVMDGKALIDRAIVRFDAGRTLPKFQLNPNSTKVYIPQEDKSYAIAVAENNVGEMPVSFKAEKNGSYAIGFTCSEVTFSYLHLIDNMTGADIDLLTTPSYTFEAKTTDYASRFRLVFSAESTSTGSAAEPFAFVNNGEIVLTVDVETQDFASLQIVDLTGRVIYQGAATNRVPTSGMVPGLYVLRLICGDEVNTQKIVLP